MKLTRYSSLLLALAACGGGSATTQEFRANAPTYEKLAISQVDDDQAEPVAAAAPDAIAQDVTADAAADACHPHLFVRTHEIIGRVNRHFFKLLRHVRDVIEDHPAVAAAGTHVWENVRDGIDRKLTMTRTANADGSVTYDFKLEVKKAADAAFVQVMSGTLTHVGPAEAEDTDAPASVLVSNTGSVTFDFTALASVVTSERARGQITDAFANVHDPAHGVKRTATMTLTNFVPEEGDKHGPRNGSYSWEREPGVGGKFQFQDSLVLLCPSNPALAAADLTSVARWYRTADGVHGRTDAKATGGQIAAGNSWIGVTCAQGGNGHEPPEAFWMMKLEDATGATVAAQSSTLGTAPCDSVFGPVPNVTDNSTDYDFSAAVTFPGEW